MRDYFLDRDFCESVIVTFFELTFNVAVEFLFFLEVNEVIVILRSIKEFSPYFWERYVSQQFEELKLLESETAQWSLAICDITFGNVENFHSILVLFFLLFAVPKS